LILTHRLMAAGKAQGFYFGLPTMATANAMFDRMSESWLALYQPDSRPSLVLAHSARGLMDASINLSGRRISGFRRTRRSSTFQPGLRRLVCRQ
jgi:hypothetical protein